MARTLRSFASHGTTLCIFLSITRVRQIVEDLLAGGYTSDTPVVVVYRASWPDQKIIRSTIASLAADVKQARISRQALIMVGWALSTDATEENTQEHRSHLYLPGYKHLFRGGTSDNENSDPEDETNGDDGSAYTQERDLPGGPHIG